MAGKLTPSDAPRWDNCPGRDAPTCPTCGRKQLPNCDGSGRIRITRPNARGLYLSAECPNDA